MVYLIGAGPGHIGYISVLGAKIIQQADCIIYDRLLNQELLKNCKEECEMVYAGKKSNHHTLPQDQINAILIQKAKQHKIVVRLKGGDNYVFGRGGEEGIALYNAGIPFEVIPGIPSFIGGLASAGIPITHRGVATGIHILTAHKQNNEYLGIDYASIKDNETTVFMMGLSKLEEIVSNLLKYKDESFPIAIVYNGSNKNQRVLVSNLKNVLEDFNKDPFPSPCLIVVGNVIQFQNQLNFNARKKEIAFIRVSNDESKLTEQLQLLGYKVNEYHVANLQPIKQKIDVNGYTHIVFASKFGVQCFFNQLKEGKVDIRTLAHLSFCAIGNATKQALEEHGIYTDYCPSYYTSNDLCALLNESLQKDANVLICTVPGNEKKWDTLNYQKEFLYLYENQEIEHSIQSIQEQAIIFTCSSAVKRCLDQVPLPKDIHIFSIGKKTTQTLREYGYTNVFESNQADYPSLIECILDQFRM